MSPLEAQMTIFFSKVFFGFFNNNPGHSYSILLDKELEKHF
jgi:hypothetical protein